MHLLRRITQHVQDAYGMSVDESQPIIHEDNAACITQIQSGYIKSKVTNHITTIFSSICMNSIGTWIEQARNSRNRMLQFQKSEGLVLSILVAVRGTASVDEGALRLAKWCLDGGRMMTTAHPRDCGGGYEI
jgi:hypothetical protein